MKLEIKPEMLNDFPACPGCGAHGQVEWHEYQGSVDCYYGYVRCSQCYWWHQDEDEVIEVGISLGRLFIGDALSDWVKAAKKWHASCVVQQYTALDCTFDDEYVKFRRAAIYFHTEPHLFPRRTF